MNVTLAAGMNLGVKNELFIIFFILSERLPIGTNYDHVVWILAKDSLRP